MSGGNGVHAADGAAVDGAQGGETIRSLVINKLTRVIGASRAESLIAEVLHELDLEALETPRELLAVSEALMARAGFIRVLAMSLKARAIVLGGRDPDDDG